MKSKRLISAAVLILTVMALSVGLAACKREEVSVSLNTESIGYDTPFFAEEEFQLVATPVNTTAAAAFTSLDESIATVTADGLVTAVAVGETTVVASVEGKNASCLVKVSAEGTLSLSETGKTVKKYDSFTLTAKFNGEDIAEGETVEWTVQNGTAATVTGSGATVTVKAAGAGTTNIRAQYKRAIGIMSLSVQRLDINLTANASESLVIGNQKDLVYELTGADVQHEKAAVTFESSDTNILTVNESGRITAKAKGSAVVTIKCEDRTATVNVSVTTALSVSVSEQYCYGVPSRDRFTPQITVKYENEPYGTANIAWSSNNPDIATVNAATGEITFVSAGTAVITVTAAHAVTGETADAETFAVSAAPVSNIAEFKAIRNARTAAYAYYLTADIDLESSFYSLAPQPNVDTRNLHNLTAFFEAWFDGNGHAIKNVLLSGGAPHGGGGAQGNSVNIFGYVKGTVQNVSFLSATVDNGNGAAARRSIFAGVMDGGVIQNVYAEVFDISTGGYGGSSGFQPGGLVSFVEGTVKDCVLYWDYRLPSYGFTETPTSDMSLGAFAGWIAKEGLAIAATGTAPAGSDGSYTPSADGSIVNCHLVMPGNNTASPFKVHANAAGSAYVNTVRKTNFAEYGETGLNVYDSLNAYKVALNTIAMPAAWTKTSNGYFLGSYDNAGSAASVALSYSSADISNNTTPFQIYKTVDNSYTFDFTLADTNGGNFTVTTPGKDSLASALSLNASGQLTFSYTFLEDADNIFAICFYENRAGGSVYVFYIEIIESDYKVVLTEDPPSVSLAVGGTHTILYSLLYLKAPYVGADTPTFTSNGTSIATVDASGEITAESVGTTTITVTFNDSPAATFTVTVLPDVLLTLAEGAQFIGIPGTDTLQLNPALTVSAVPETPDSIDYESNAEGVATVSASGLITIVGPGTAVITVTAMYDGAEATAQITIIGTKAIASAAELRKIGADNDYPSNGYYHLANDIDLGGTAAPNICATNGAAVWVNPYADGQTYFDGYFDGNGYAIKKFTIANGFNLGVFGYVTGTVKNTMFLGVNIIAAGGNNNSIFSGVLQGGLIENCYAEVFDVTIPATASAAFIGYIEGTVKDCVLVYDAPMRKTHGNAASFAYILAAKGVVSVGSPNYTYGTAANSYKADGTINNCYLIYPVAGETYLRDIYYNKSTAVTAGGTRVGSTVIGTPNGTGLYTLTGNASFSGKALADLGLSGDIWEIDATPAKPYTNLPYFKGKTRNWGDLVMTVHESADTTQATPVTAISGGVAASFVSLTITAKIVSGSSPFPVPVGFGTTDTNTITLAAQTDVNLTTSSLSAVYKKGGTVGAGGKIIYAASFGYRVNVTVTFT